MSEQTLTNKAVDEMFLFDVKAGSCALIVLLGSRCGGTGRELPGRGGGYAYRGGNTYGQL